jgi:glycosyltransferase involved in cell wall biosynthesis
MLAGVILTKNEAHHIEDCIASLRWCDRVILSDSYSDDGTVEIARSAGAEVIQRAFDNFAAQRDAALRAVNAEWIFFVDADERATPDLAAEIRSAVDDESKAGWWVPRHNVIVGRVMRHGGYYPDYQLRLLRRGRARYDPARPVHEVVILDGEEGFLQNPLTHYNYYSWAQVHEKQRRYARLEAQRLADEGVQPRPHKFVTQPLREFYRRVATLQGYKDGLHGLRLHALLAYYYGFLPYVHLRALRRRV